MSLSAPETGTASAHSAPARFPLAGTRSSRPPLHRRDWLWALLFLGPQLVGLLAFVAFPFGFGVVLSFMSWDGFGQKSWVGFANFRAELSDPLFGRAVLNTFELAAISVPVGLGLALLIAIALNHVRGRSFYRVLYFAPVVTSSVAVAVIWQVILSGGDQGILNGTVHSLTGVQLPDWLADPRWAMVAVAIVTIWSSLGLNVVIFQAGLETISPTVIEAARIDGAGSWAVHRRVVLPLLSPTIFFQVVIALISSLQAFDTIFILTNDGGPDNSTRTIVYHIYDTGFRRFEFGVSSAAAVLLLLLTLVVTLVQFGLQRRFVHYEE